MEYRYKTRFCPVLETDSIRFPRKSYDLPPCCVRVTSGVSTPSSISVIPGNRSAIITFVFTFPMGPEDHFLITIMNANEDTEVRTTRFQPNTQYAISGLVNGVPYYAIIVPVINGIRYGSGTSADFTPS
jgi:hypothetical protein